MYGEREHCKRGHYTRIPHLKGAKKPTVLNYHDKIANQQNFTEEDFIATDLYEYELPAENEEDRDWNIQLNYSL